MYFKKDIKCDSIDNNMSKSFNVWIVGPRHKTIIIMLEEIRVKVMTRIGQFTHTWLTNIDPMSLRVLEKNKEKSMRCNIEFNGEKGFEINGGPYQHTITVRSKTCTCRAWMLKRIPFPHSIATIFYKKWKPSDFVDSCYSKETYLRTYCHFLQPVINIKMWLDSTNPHVQPPVVKFSARQIRKSQEKRGRGDKQMWQVVKKKSLHDLYQFSW